MLASIHYILTLRPDLDDDRQRAYRKEDTLASDELVRYQEYLRQELPPAVRRELEALMEREFNDLEEQLKGRLVDIVRDLQFQLFDAYTQSHQNINVRQSSEDPLIQPTLDTQGAYPTAINATSSTQVDFADPKFTTTSLFAVDAENEELMATAQSASFEAALHTNEFLDFDPILFQLPDLQDFDDSGYGSLFGFAPEKAHDYESLECYYDCENDNREGPSRAR